MYSGNRIFIILSTLLNNSSQFRYCKKYFVCYLVKYCSFVIYRHREQKSACKQAILTTIFRSLTDFHFLQISSLAVHTFKLLQILPVYRWISILYAAHLWRAEFRRKLNTHVSTVPKNCEHMQFYGNEIIKKTCAEYG